MPAFYLLFLGYALGMIILLIEFLYHHFKLKNNQMNFQTTKYKRNKLYNKYYNNQYRNKKKTNILKLRKIKKYIL